MNSNEHLTPEESEQKYAPLIADLRTLYAQPEEDAQSLSHIQQRLANSYSQENSIRFSSSPVTIRKVHKERSYVLNSYENNLEKLHVRNRPWLRYFSTIAAVVFVSLLVGSMLLVFTHVRLSGSASGPVLPATPTPMPVVCNTPTPTPTVTFPQTPTPTPISPAVTPSPTTFPPPTPTPVVIIGHPQCATPTPMPTPTPITPTPFPTGIPMPTPTPIPTPIP